MNFFQKTISLPAFPRGYHLITREVLSQFPDIKSIETGFLHVFIKHTSASLTINENADESVRDDFESHMNKLVPEDAAHFTHTMEGPDDMPAHIKASMMGSSVQIPVKNGALQLGTWQGIYLCEHRDRGGARKLVVTAFGS
ncbi:MAG: secondary thiamine-phosphate synthase enzyme YjbQ [Flavobacteriaceae bacterium]|nr:secondary thiamine-phosphate synthase enzyme YjbQ [Flavobacteriaceae bacterium]